MVNPLRQATVDAATHGSFDRLPEGSRMDAVTDRLRQAIALGVLRNSARLPSESDLASRLGVSTLTLRESLGVLRHQGLIETRRGRGGGSFVRLGASARERLVGERLRSMSLDELRDLRDYQSAVSGRAAALAAERAPGASIERLRHGVEAQRTSSDGEESVRADAAFHVEIARLSHSARLTRAELTAQGDLAPLLWLGRAGAWEPSASADAHLAILTAVRERDPVRARVLAEQHVQDGADRLIRLKMEHPEDWFR